MVNIGKGDLVRMELTGRLASDNAAFESTDEEIAKKEGIWSNASKYGSRLVIYGRGAMIEGLEEKLPNLEIGKEEIVEVSSAKAFGQRFNELVRVMPEKEFLKHGVTPQVGLMVTIDGVPALVKSVSSGRIMLDFNHPLAGQDVKYDIKLLEVISEPKQKADELAKQFNSTVTVDENNGKKMVKIPKGLEVSKARGLEAALRASVGDWAQIEIEK